MVNEIGLDNPTTIIILWVLTWLTIPIMVLRLVMRKVRRQKFEVGDFITMVAIICLIAQNCLVHIILRLGTNLIRPEDMDEYFKSPLEALRNRALGGKLTIVNRVVMIT